MTPLLTVKQAAEVLGRPPSAVYELARRGDLAHIRMPGRGKRAVLRFRPGHIEDFLRRHERTVETAARR